MFARRLIPLVILTLVTINASPSAATTNDRPVAWLTWSADRVESDYDAPPSSASLYLYVEGAAAFRGADADLMWSFRGDACATLTAARFRATHDCRFLNRGTVAAVTLADTLGHYHVSWTSTRVNTECSANGNIAELQFALNGCRDVPGCFRLQRLSLIDAHHRLVRVLVAGDIATIKGGASICDSVPAAAALVPAAAIRAMAAPGRGAIAHHAQPSAHATHNADPSRDAMLSADPIPLPQPRTRRQLTPHSTTRPAAPKSK